ncbi:hypothetical protein FCM35_KLT11295 [Carex littledalei]|uniref:Uncharacterized protein n=1 Tax=Carex littledalei TaxID=544730 RepID=A0A833QQI5_9POAL|nr:hypothetical protein FCM35_KLT11295 [Carex littledalei]
MKDLKDAIVKGLGLQSDLKVSGFDVRDALAGKAVAYEFAIEIGKKMIPVKLLEDVSRWDFVDLPFFHRMNGGNEAKEGNSLAKMGKKKDAIDLPEFPPFQLAGDDMRLAIPACILEGEANWDKYPEWRTRPQKSRAHFEVLARVEEGGREDCAREDI